MFDIYMPDSWSDGIEFEMFGPVPNKDMKKSIVFKSGQIFWKDAHCSENYFESYIRFFRLLVFEIWSILYMVDYTQY